jgi:hypothetical protein
MSLISVMFPPGRLRLATRPFFHRVGTDDEDDGDCRGRLFGGEGRRGADRRNDDSHIPADQLCRQRWQALVVTFGPAVFDRDVMTFDEADFA